MNPKWLNEAFVSELDNNYAWHVHNSECDTDFPIIFVNVKYFLDDWVGGFRQRNVCLVLYLHNMYMIFNWSNSLQLAYLVDSKQAIIFTAIVMWTEFEWLNSIFFKFFGVHLISPFVKWKHFGSTQTFRLMLELTRLLS